MATGFMMFPTGSAGVALLLIRAALAIALGAMAAWAEADAARLALAFLSGTILAGFRTRLAAVAAAMVAAVVATRLGGPLGLSAALHGCCAVALAMLGAGGYSIDARLFGRRVIDFDR